jgi:hypothetical protein
VTAVREAIVLPALFLTVTLLGGLRPGHAQILAPPSLFSLVLAMLLVAALVQSGALAPDRLMSDRRAWLPNLNGLVVLLGTFVASAQTFTLVTPESGLPAVVVATFFFIALLHTLTVAPDRVRMLRGLMVLIGATFVIKFIVLATLSQPADGRFARAMQLLFEGVTLGAISQTPPHPAAGYLAFAVLILYFAGLLLLPSAGWTMTRVPEIETMMTVGHHETKLTKND